MTPQASPPRTAPSRAMPDHSTYPALDGVRAVAVAMVVATHAAFWTGGYVNSSFKAPLARLDSGVAVFFVLSGFLLVRPWLSAAQHGRAMPSVRAYLWRRALRILPLYYVTVVLAFLVVDQEPALTPADWWHHGLLVQILHFGWLRGGLTHTWSLSVEASFYLVLPLLGITAVAYSRRFGWRPVHLLTGLAALASVSIWYPALIFHTELGLTYTGYLWLPAYFSWFAGGIALAVIDLQARTGALTGAWAARLATAQAVPGIWLTTAIGIFALACTPIAGPLGLATSNERWTPAVRSTLYALAAIAVVFPAVFSPSSTVTRFLASRPMQWLGKISYGVFLLHLVILELVMKLFGWPLFGGHGVYLFLVTCLLSIPAAALAWRFVEAPAMRLRGMVASSAPPPKQQAQAQGSQGDQAEQLDPHRAGSVMAGEGRPEGDRNGGDGIRGSGQPAR